MQKAGGAAPSAHPDCAGSRLTPGESLWLCRVRRRACRCVCTEGWLAGAARVGQINELSRLGTWSVAAAGITCPFQTVATGGRASRRLKALALSGHTDRKWSCPDLVDR